MSADVLENGNASIAQTPNPAELNPPFEGPEKLLELWFEPAESDSQDTERPGLLAVPREKWEEMLDIVRCKVLNVIQGKKLDAYLLSESSLFIYPYKLILKTCGTTLNLLGVPRILEIAREECSLNVVNKCFYSRKSFMFPERQSGPHRDWKEEVRFLDEQFEGGAAYTVGKMNGDHWLLWFFDNDYSKHAATSPSSSPVASTSLLQSVSSNAETNGVNGSHTPKENVDEPLDYTLEILMSDLAPESRDHFFFPTLHLGAEAETKTNHEPLKNGAQENGDNEDQTNIHPTGNSISTSTSRSRALELSEKLGITNIFPPSLSQLDAYAFEPCGYSANAVISPKKRHSNCGEGYWTIHVTPEQGWSYASFECNVPASASISTSTDSSTSIPASPSPYMTDRTTNTNNDTANNTPDLDPPSSPSDQNHTTFPNLYQLIQRVVTIFKPGNLTVTLFVANVTTTHDSPIESAQHVFRKALESKGYKRSDKITYEFSGYDLAFASFKL